MRLKMVLLSHFKKINKKAFNNEEVELYESKDKYKLTIRINKGEVSLNYYFNKKNQLEFRTFHIPTMGEGCKITAEELSKKQKQKVQKYLEQLLN